MGIIRIDVDVDCPTQPVMRVTLRHVLVNQEAERSWFPANILEAVDVEPIEVVSLTHPDGAIVEREVGTVAVYLLGRETRDEVVFAHPGDPTTLGRQTMARLNVRLDATQGTVVPADQ